MNLRLWIGIGVALAFSAIVCAPVQAQTAARFSSTFTDLKYCVSNLEPNQEKEILKHGAKLPSFCLGPDDYAVTMHLHGTHVQVQLRQRTLLAGEAYVWMIRWEKDLYVGDGGSVQRIEWRMADGKPFALILRREIVPEAAPSGKKKVEEILVKGGADYQGLEATIKVKRFSSVNKKAQRIADQFYRSRQP